MSNIFNITYSNYKGLVRHFIILLTDYSVTNTPSETFQ